jgi:signal peptidase I
VTRRWLDGDRASMSAARAVTLSLSRLIGTVALPALAAMLALRFALPSRMDGAAGGVRGFLAFLNDRYPLFVGVALFVAFSETGRYWSRRWRGVDRVEPARRSTRRWLAALAVIAVLAFVVRSSVAATFRVVGPSMLPTLGIGDRVLVDRLAYGVKLPLAKTRLAARAPARGDLVVFRADGLIGDSGPQSIVKRVMGVPGDRIAFQKGSVFINGWQVPACDAGPYVSLVGNLTVRGRLVVEYLGDKTYLTVRKPVEQPFAGYTVKSGEVFVLGDDRGMSSDSRVWSESHGAGVQIEALEGTVARVLLGARPDGRLDFSRLLAPALDLEVRQPGFDLHLTDERIAHCLARRPTSAWPPNEPPVDSVTNLSPKEAVISP